MQKTWHPNQPRECAAPGCTKTTERRIDGEPRCFEHARAETLVAHEVWIESGVTHYTRTVDIHAANERDAYRKAKTMLRHGEFLRGVVCR